ncbi:MAG TPA: sulfatase-like hydrolase/transferase [Anaeromyxobacter sp.]
MLGTSAGGEPTRAPGAGQRFAALVWALLHAPLFLALFAPGIAGAIRSAPGAYRLALWPTFLPQATLLALVAFALALPFSVAPTAYRFAAPGAAALVTAGLALDARIYQSVGFHLNGFFLRFLAQPNALKEAGVPLSDVAVFLGFAAAFAAIDVAAGAWFIRRFGGWRRRAWPLALALVLLSAGERVYGTALTFFGGPSFFAASTVMPLQPPVRWATLWIRIFGERAQKDPFARAGASKRLPSGLDPRLVHLARTPDVLFVVAESLPADHLDARTMPHLWQRAQGGARFTRHYAGASSTNYSLFTLMYGLQAQKLEATIGAGRRPVLFPALADHGYRTKILAASCVDWMDLKDTVFGGVPPEDLRTWCDDVEPPDRDAAMLAEARAFTASADPRRPVFLFLFFFGTHFNYFLDDQDRVFEPFWDGAGGIKATAAPGALIDARARNAAHKVDRVLDGFLTEFERVRGRAPLVVFTGDHGEEFRQKGHIGHGSAVTSEQIHVPAVWFGPGVPTGVFDVPTSHSDVVPTLLALLGDDHAPSLYADGVSMFQAPPDRFVVSTVGWEPYYAATGKDLKVKMYAGLGTAEITDPEDRPIPDGPARMAASAGRILKALRGEAQDPAQLAQPRAAAARP